MNIVTTKDNFKNAVEGDIKGKVVRSQPIARRILALGGRDVWLFDIKPDRSGNGDKTVFIFEDTDKFQEIFQQVIEERKARREENDSDKKISNLEKEVEELKKIIAAKEN